METACKYRCHSALKLLWLDKKFNIFTRTNCTTVLDLAAAPGGFAQVALQQMNSHVCEKFMYNNDDSSRTTMLPEESSQIHHSQNYKCNNKKEKEKVKSCEYYQKSHFTPKVIAVDLRPIAPMPHLNSIRCNLLKHQEVLCKVKCVLQSLQSREQQQGYDLKQQQWKDSEYEFTPETFSNAANNKRCLSKLTLEERNQREATTMMPLDRHISETDKQHYEESEQQRSIDVILHDGMSVIAGHDKFSPLYAQNQMTLSALLLACKVFDKFNSHNLITVKRQSHAVLHRYKQKSKTHLVQELEKKQWEELHLELERNKTSGRTETNANSPCARSISLPSSSLEADSTILPVCFVSKLLRSSHSDFVADAFRTFFHEVYLYKPETSYAWNKESYLVAFDFDRRQWHNALRGKPIYKNASKSLAQVQQTKNCNNRINSVLKSSTTPNHSRVKGWNKTDMTHGQVVFSMHPYRTDAPHEANQVVWKCLGCGQCRIGCVPCMICNAVSEQRYEEEAHKTK